MKSIWLFCILIMATSGAAAFDGSVLAWRERGDPAFKSAEESFKKTLQVLKNKHADKTLTEEELYRAATEGMLAALNGSGEGTDDKHWNVLLTPRQFQDMNIEFSGKLTGIGATLDFDNDNKNGRILGVLPASAAQKAGLKKGDFILSVDGKRFNNIGDLVSRIRGKEGETVRLKILRGDQILDFKIKRAAVKIPVFEVAQLDEETAYLKINTFNKEPLTELKKRLGELETKKPKKLIIDLRSNFGGAFEKCQEITDIFLAKDQLIAKSKSRDGVVKDIVSQSKKSWSPQTRLVILTNQETSSSAEVMTAALKENRQALIIGQKTAGKWSVEALEALPNGYHIKYSVFSLLSPSGKNYQNTGITPDLETAELKKEETAALQGLKVTDPQFVNKDPTLRAAIEITLP